MTMTDPAHPKSLQGKWFMLQYPVETENISPTFFQGEEKLEANGSVSHIIFEYVRNN